MANFRGSTKITRILISAMSISLVILLSSMAIVALESEPSESLIMSTLPPENPEHVIQSTEASLPGGMTKKECKKFLMYFAKKMLKKLNGCSKEMKKQYPDKEEYSKRFDCSLRCVMHEIELLDENYNMNNATIHSFMDEWVPQQYRVIAWHFGMPCINTFGYKLNDGDPYCKQYGKFVTCLQNAVADC